MTAHRSDDPIVFPGQPGVSHNHTFAGNTATDASSTAATLLPGKTSCQDTADTSAYWAPTLYADGRPVAPVKAAIYYRRLTTAPVRPFPAGLRMVAGNAHAFRPQSSAVTYWDCSLLKTTFYGPNGGGSSAITAAASSTVPTCPQKAEVQLHVKFPACWDGKRLDSFDHRSHMAYARGGQCPAGHPVALPALSLVYMYPARAVDAARVIMLSSGGQYSGHADFFNAWNAKELRRLVRVCINAGRQCNAKDAAG